MLVKYYITTELFYQATNNNFRLDKVIPRIKHEGGPWGDVGIDLFCPVKTIVWPFIPKVISTGIIFGGIPGYSCFIKPRSGDDFLIGAGVGDPGYVGPMKVKIINTKPWPLFMHVGSSLGQLVLVKTADDLHITQGNLMDLPVTDRGSSGRINLQKGV